MEAQERITLVGLLFETALGFRRLLGPGAEAGIGVGGEAMEICIRLVRSPAHSMRMSDLATQTGISPSGLTRAIDRLFEAGLVERSFSPSDRRVTYAVLTELGCERVNCTLEGHRQTIDALLDGVLTDEEEALLGDLLKRIRNRVNPEAAFLSLEAACEGDQLPDVNVNGAGG